MCSMNKTKGSIRSRRELKKYTVRTPPMIDKGAEEQNLSRISPRRDRHVCT